MSSSDAHPAGSPGVFAARRRAVRVAPADLVVESPLEAGAPMPLVFRPTRDDVDLAEYVGLNRERLRTMLMRTGALLFRGFRVDGASYFERVAERFGGPLLEYRERSSPRTQIERHVYTSTEYPAGHEIFFHNENSYQQTWPMKIFFHCDTPAETGGETPIADTRRVYQRIPAAMRARFEREGVLYVRNFGGGIGLPWQTVFQTTSRAEVEQYCTARGIAAGWKSGDRLVTRARRQAVAAHPVTGDMSWFNHGAFFHPSTLTPAVRDALLAGIAEDDLPNNTYYGDGGPIEPEVLETVRRAYRDETVTFPWQAGDLLALDNMIVAHGRASFSGPRRVLVAMCESSDSFVP